MWNMVRIGFKDSDKKAFENVDGRRTTDTCLYYKLTYEPNLLRRANNYCTHSTTSTVAVAISAYFS